MGLTNFDERMETIKQKHNELRSEYTDKEYIERLEDALQAVEFIAMHQEDLPKNINTDKEQELHDAITKIYRISHTSRLPGCMDLHPQWEEELKEMSEIAKQ